MPGEPGQELRFDITDLYMTAPAFARAGSSLGDSVEQASARLERLGSFWGNDKPGQRFKAVYAPSQERLLQLLSILSGEVAGIADGINKMADEYGIAEQSNINKIREMNQEFP